MLTCCRPTMERSAPVDWERPRGRACSRTAVHLISVHYYASNVVSNELTRLTAWNAVRNYMYSCVHSCVH